MNDYDKHKEQNQNYYLDLTKSGLEQEQAAQNAQQPASSSTHAFAEPNSGPAAAPSTPSAASSPVDQPCPASELIFDAKRQAEPMPPQSSGLQMEQQSRPEQPMLPLPDLPQDNRPQIPWDAHSAFAGAPPLWEQQKVEYSGLGGAYQAKPDGEARPEYEQAAAPPLENAVRLTVPERRETRKPGQTPPRVSISRKALTMAVVLCLLISSVMGIGGGWLAYQWFGGEQQNTPSTADLDGSGGGTINRTALLDSGVTEGMTPAQVAEFATDSVVEIFTEYSAYNLFGRRYTQPGAGSGVIISENGLIITNNHVVEDAVRDTADGRIYVTLRNGESYEATVIATDAETDVAVIKIGATGLIPAILGDSSALREGDLAVVIGNPLGQLGGSVTVGVISALDREITLDGQVMNLMQTDAAINNGNSGGGLFNQYGELVGIIVAKSGGISVEGLGFAIPLNDVRGVIDELISEGDRVLLGVSMLNILDEQTAISYRVDEPGAYVYRVQADSNAERAGLEVGDRLLSVNGRAIATADDVSAEVQACEAGETMTIVYERDGEQYTTSVVMQKLVSDDDLPNTTGSQV